MSGELVADHVLKTFTVGRGGTTRERRAVNDVSLAVSPGEIVGLVGESGSGKTTLSRIMIGIETATAGEITYDGRPVRTRAQWRALRRSVQYVPGPVHGALPHHADRRCAG